MSYPYAFAAPIGSDGPAAFKAIRAEASLPEVEQVDVDPGALELRAVFLVELDAAQQATLASVVAPFVDAFELDRRALVVAIDHKTSAMIRRGFAYSGSTFSLANSSQRNLLGLWNIRANPALYPIGYNTQDDLATPNEISLADSAAVEAFYAAAQTAIMVAKDGGRQIKALAKAAATQADLDTAHALNDAR